MHEAFSNEAKTVIQQNSDTSLLMKQLDEDLESFILHKNLKSFSFVKSINIKRAMYRSITSFIGALSRLHNVDKSSTFQDIAELLRLNTISKSAANRISHALAVACHIKLSHYMCRKRQDDDIYKETEIGGREKMKELTIAVGQKYLVKCLVAAFVFAGNVYAKH